MTKNFKAYHRWWTMTYMAYVEFAIEDTTQKFDVSVSLKLRFAGTARRIPLINQGKAVACPLLSVFGLDVVAAATA